MYLKSLPISEELSHKYTAHPKNLKENKLIPVLSNQKMDAYLKEIAGVCGIKKDLTFHIARHTFATTATLTNGVPIESVSKMLGHKSIKTIQHYAKILDKKVSEDMDLLKSKLSNFKVGMSRMELLYKEIFKDHNAKCSLLQTNKSILFVITSIIKIHSKKT